MRFSKSINILALVYMFFFLFANLTDSNVHPAISWSSHLDPIFASNLERDPALSWQYFGSRTGFLRRFPGTAWPNDASTEHKPITDFRVDDWFIQAAASPKDVVSFFFKKIRVWSICTEINKSSQTNKVVKCCQIPS